MIQKVTVRDVAESLGATFSGLGEDAEVFDVTHDSRQAGKNSLFAAVRGLTTDGHRFAEDVIRRGAVGIISELDAPDNFQGAWLKVADARESLAKAAAVINGNPSHDLKLVGITGTNGKTTTTYLCFALAEAERRKMPAMLTTVEYRIGEKSRSPLIQTTTQKRQTQIVFFGTLLDEGCTNRRYGDFVRRRSICTAATGFVTAWRFSPI